MINPSVHGWIDKFFQEQDYNFPVAGAKSFYEAVRATGFIYGHIVAFHTPRTIDHTGWLGDETSKAAMLSVLYGVYRLVRPQGHPANFTKEASEFYQHVSPGGFNPLRKMLPGQTPSALLEKYIDERIHANDNIISKNFSHIVTNALLFADALAFMQFLEGGTLPEKYLKKMEDSIISVVTLALQSKTNKSQHDKHLVKLFEASVRYGKFSKVSINDMDKLDFGHFTNTLEKYYLIDMAGLALWSDAKIENEEAYFLHALAANLDVDDNFVTRSILDTDAFITRYKHEIPYFNYSNPVKHFYDQATQLVVTLINRNRKRLVKEIAESGELMVLLAQSTQRDLDKSEKKKVKKQLLDICKSVPSLTIFLIPGGSLLLPILVKFIPQLLPSSFNENLADDE